MLGGQREMYVNDYKFDIRPATDDRPYFSSFFKWAHAPEVLALSRKGGIGLLDLGYLALPAALVQAVVASAALILLPLFALRRGRGGARRWPALAGFFCIGLAFLLIEIAFIGRFTVILSHPLHALVVVLAAFLLFAGVGSYLSGRRGSGASIVVPIIGIAAIAITYALLSPYLTSALIGAPPAAKIGAAFVVIAPLATLMGMPFPRALARLNAVDPSLLPWAWGINGVRVSHRSGACDGDRNSHRPHGGDSVGRCSLLGGGASARGGWRLDESRHRRGLGSVAKLTKRYCWAGRKRVRLMFLRAAEPFKPSLQAHVSFDSALIHYFHRDMLSAPN